MGVVVIVGGSFAGLQTAVELCGYDELEVVVIDPKEYWEFTPSIHTAIGGGRDAGELMRPLDETLVSRTKFVVGKVVGIEEDCVRLEDKSSVKFDYLVIASGCGYADPIRSVDAKKTDRLNALRATSERIEKASSVLVIGGGAVGVEICGEIVAADPSKKVVLATLDSELVPDCPKATRDKAKSALEAKGVRIITGRMVKTIEDGEYMIGEEEKLSVDACVWCFAGKPNTKFESSWLQLDKRGFVAIDPGTRRCLGNTKGKCFAVGDVASKPDAQRLASYAHLEGEYVAHQIIADFHGSSPPASYVAPPRLVALSLGPRDGAFVYDSVPFTAVPGFLIPYLKTIIEKWFIRLLPMPYAVLKLLPGDEAARAWGK